SNSANASEAACMTGQSESEPITTATRGVWGVFVIRSSYSLVGFVLGGAVADDFGGIHGSGQRCIKVAIGRKHIDVSDFTTGTHRFAVGMDFCRRILLHRQREGPVKIMIFGTQVVFHHRVWRDRIGSTQW